MIRSTLKKYIQESITKYKGDAVLRYVNRRPKILFYHGVATKPDKDIETESIAVDDFVRQLKYLKKYYRLVGIREFLHLYANHQLKGDEVSLTFDDGYKNILHTAAPILDEQNVPYSLYLTTNNISNGTLFPTTINRIVVRASSLHSMDLDSVHAHYDLSTPELKEQAQNQISRILKTSHIELVNQIVTELETKITSEEMFELRERYNSIEPLCWEECTELVKDPLITIGSHGMDHICCHSEQTKEEVRRQLLGSKQEIESRLGISCDIFSYPNGNFTEESNTLLKEVGYKMGLTTKRRHVYDGTLFSVPRLYTPYDYERFVYSLTTYPY